MENVLVSLASKEIAMKLVFSTLAFASGAAMAAAATLPVVVGGIAAMCFLFAKRAKREGPWMSAMPEAKLTGRNTCNDAKTSARKATRQTRLWFRKLPTGHPKRLLHRCV
jgi:hypothetical protein